MHFNISSRLKKFSFLKTALWGLTALSMVVFVSGCSQPRKEDKPFNPAECMENIPKDIKGLVVLEGPRTRESIIVDMQPVVCSAHALFQKMRQKGKQISDGKVVFRVVVEYNGEVINASVEESTVESEEFMRKVTGSTLAHDFGVWNRNDVDAVFLYPATFGK